MPRVFAGIGSNVDREASIRGAVQKIREAFDGLCVSPVYCSPAHGFSGDDFYNLAVGFDTALALPTLLTKMKTLETAFGRQRQAQRFVARSLDIDLLLYGNLRDAERDIPSADILGYYFVLRPLVDIAPTLHHPVTGRTLSEHWSHFDKTGMKLHNVPMQL